MKSQLRSSRGSVWQQVLLDAELDVLDARRDAVDDLLLGRRPRGVHDGPRGVERMLPAGADALGLVGVLGVLGESSHDKNWTKMRHQQVGQKISVGNVGAYSARQG